MLDGEARRGEADVIEWFVMMECVRDVMCGMYVWEEG